MREVLVLRLDAPLMSFGGVKVDNRGGTLQFPPLSMLTGLLGNALGYDHRDAERLAGLQGRLRYAVRCDRPGERVTDYQTVDLGQEHLMEPGWTTRGAPEGRGGGKEAREGTHIRLREYWADAVYTLVVALDPEAGDPDLATLELAVQEPERPVFLGRKPCLPATPLLVERRRSGSLLEALEQVPRLARDRWRGEAAAPLLAWLPEGENGTRPSRQIPVTDERDWENQIVVGRRIVRETTVNPREARHAG